MTGRDFSKSGPVEDFLVDPTRDLRYAELAIVGDQYVSFYNSIGIHEAPADQWDALDADAAATDIGAAMVVKNGPHWWASDTARLYFGSEVIEVDGLGFRFASNLPVAIMAGGGVSGKHYQPFDADKHVDLTYWAGKPVYELVAPEGDVYLMQSTSAAMDDFDSLGDRLSPADGWTFRIRVLDEDLVYPIDGSVPVVMDDTGNVYNLAP